MWRKFSFYRQVVILTSISAALVFLIVWIRRRNQNESVTIRLQPQRDTSLPPHGQIFSSTRVPKQKGAKKAYHPSGEKPIDDLTIILGIGPKSAVALQKAGILTFKDIAELNEHKLDNLLREQAIRIPRTETWSEQANLAAQGDFKKLKELQASLKKR